MGFKSIFSLGDSVELYTPSLSVIFNCHRFTEPIWSNVDSPIKGKTCIRVKISGPFRENEIKKNLEQWLKSPASLLFFNHIRLIQIEEETVQWGSLGPGPVEGSEWFALFDKQDKEFLLLRSGAEAFPEESLAEIREERMLGLKEEAGFPPCKIDILLGAPGRLFVVLPTGVETALPFACNAPFIQDPARMEIKDPEISPTNRWLLERTGKFAGSAMLSWLNHSKLPMEERAWAYGLLPDVDREDDSLEGVCGKFVEEAFEKVIEGKEFLLTNKGALTLEQDCVVVPEQVCEVWTEEQVVALIDGKARPILSRHVKEADKQKLVNWRVVDEIGKQKLIDIFQKKHLPKPEAWLQLLNLWAYIAPEIAGYHDSNDKKDIHIVPVQGKDVLCSANEVVRLGEKRLLQSEEDWQFLANYLTVLNQNWTRFIADQKRIAQEQNDESSIEKAEAAFAILEKIGLDKTSDINEVIDQVAIEFFSQKGQNLDQCIQLTQIAAKLGVNIGNGFRYVTRNKVLKSLRDNVLFDENETLEELLPEEHRKEHLLHSEYTRSFSSCSKDEWLKWILSERAGLCTFVPLTQHSYRFHNRNEVQQELDRRGFQGDYSSPYVTADFIVFDWDFDDDFWKYWNDLAEEDDHVWGNIAERVIDQPETYWKKAASAGLCQVATTGRERSITSDFILPSWILRLRELPCLPDTHGSYRKPSELLRRTPETEALMDVEPFIHGRLDQEKTQPLLDLLGVGNTPAGPKRLLDRLGLLSKADEPPIREVEKWYRRLDQMIVSSSTSELQTIKQVFQSEKLILAKDGSWVTSSGVFLSSDENNILGAAVIRSSVEDLILWRKIGVAERPTADLVIQWLQEFTSGQKLTKDDLRKVRAILTCYPTQIWEECGHWLNLTAEWVPIDGLSYSLTMQSLIPWAHLHQWVKESTADLQGLPVSITTASPFSKLGALSEDIESRFHRDPLFKGLCEKKDWLITLGKKLQQVELENEEDTNRVRTLAIRLANTEWQNSPGLEIIPYIDDKPAGTPKRTDVVWIGQTLFVEELHKAKLAKRVPEEIGKVFNQIDIKAALDYSFERGLEDIHEYLIENFRFSKVEGSCNEENQWAMGKGSELQNEQENKGDNESNEIKNSSKLGSKDEIALQEPSEENVEALCGDEEEDLSDIDIEGNGTRSKSRPPKPNIFNKFAQANGFKKDSNDRYFHDDGGWIRRIEGEIFPWEQRTSSGELVRYYLPRDHCLKKKPLQISVEVWSLIEKTPERYSLILSNIQGDSLEITGVSLCDMVESGQIGIYPATYRLVSEEPS